MDYLVDIVGRNTGLHSSCGEVQNLTSKATDTAHALLLLLVQDLDAMLTEHALFRAGDTISSIVGVGDRLGNSALGRQRIDGAKRARVLERGVRVEKAGSWIRFRNYLRREEVGEDITLFMDGLVVTLGNS